MDFTVHLFKSEASVGGTTVTSHPGVEKKGGETAQGWENDCIHSFNG